MIYELQIEDTERPRLKVIDQTSTRVFALSRTDPSMITGRIRGSTKYNNHVACSDGSVFSAAYFVDLGEWHLIQLVKGFSRYELMSNTRYLLDGLLVWVQVRNHFHSWVPVDHNL